MSRKDVKGKEKAISPERRRDALKLRQTGLTYRVLAEQLKCSVTTAYSDVKSVLDQYQ